MFKPGEVNNPTGLLPIGKDMVEARKVSRHDFERVAHKYLQMSYKQLTELMEKRQDLPVMDVMVISTMVHAIKEGDPKRFDFILDRTIGQVVRKIRIESQPEAVTQIPIPMSEKEKLLMLDKMREVIEKRQQIIDVEVVKDETK